jgi:hypothetical protein
MYIVSGENYCTTIFTLEIVSPLSATKKYIPALLRSDAFRSKWCSPSLSQPLLRAFRVPPVISTIRRFRLPAIADILPANFQSVDSKTFNAKEPHPDH